MFVFFLSLGRYVEMVARHRAGSVADALARLAPVTARRVRRRPGRGRAGARTAARRRDAGAHGRGVRGRRRGGRRDRRPGRRVDADRRIDGDRQAARLAPCTPARTTSARRCACSVTAVAGNTVLAGHRRAARARAGRAPAPRQGGGPRGGVVPQPHPARRRRWSSRSGGSSTRRRRSRRRSRCWWSPAPARCRSRRPPCSPRRPPTSRGAACWSRTPMRSRRWRRATRVLWDKTGTLTRGLVRVEEVRPLRDAAPDDCLALAAALERMSEHPIARAFLAAGAVGRTAHGRRGDGRARVSRASSTARRLRIGTRDFARGPGRRSPPRTRPRTPRPAGCISATRTGCSRRSGSPTRCAPRPPPACGSSPRSASTPRS